MIYTNKEYCLEVKGSMACFTRPEMKVERVSYDIITWTKAVINEEAADESRKS